MQKLYVKILRSSYFQEVKHLAFFASLFFLLALGFVYFTHSSKLTNYSTELSGSGSLTSCIDMNTVSTEIEITDLALKRAFIKLSGFDGPISNDNDAPGDCQFKLV
ncbi:MAG: hypothetical protein K6L80_00165 [Agarilytica sp.]